MSPEADEPVPTEPGMVPDPAPKLTDTPDEIAATPSIAGAIKKFQPPPAPNDLSLGAPENFPIWALPDKLRAVVENLAARNQTPVCLPAMSALAVLSGAVGKSAVVRGGFKDMLTLLNLYVLAIAMRGSGKGNTGETLCRPMSLRSSELAEQHAKITAGKRGELGVVKREVGRMEMDAANSKTTGLERENMMDTLINRHARLAELEREAAREITLLV